MQLKAEENTGRLQEMINLFLSIYKYYLTLITRSFHKFYKFIHLWSRNFFYSCFLLRNLYCYLYSLSNNYLFHNKQFLVEIINKNILPTKISRMVQSSVSELMLQLVKTKFKYYGFKLKFRTSV